MVRVLLRAGSVRLLLGGHRSGARHWGKALQRAATRRELELLFAPVPPPLADSGRPPTVIAQMMMMACIDIGISLKKML